MNENFNKLIQIKFYNKKNSFLEDSMNFEPNFETFKQKLSLLIDVSIEEINKNYEIFECMNENSYNLISNNEDYLNLLNISQFILTIVVKPKKNINVNDDENSLNENNDFNNFNDNDNNNDDILDEGKIHNNNNV